MLAPSYATTADVYLFGRADGADDADYWPWPHESPRASAPNHVQGFPPGVASGTASARRAPRLARVTPRRLYRVQSRA